MAQLFKITYHVPPSHLEATKAAVFAAGAGRVGSYEHCCWQVLGEGQFRPLPGSRPHSGVIDQLETLAEYRVELVCAGAHLHDAVAELRAAHPYETPSIAVWAIEDV